MADPDRLDELKRKFDENPKRYFAPLANEYRKAGQPELAIELCRTHLPQQPTHMSGYIVYGQALHDAGHGDESAAVFKQALTLDPENIIALRHLGDISRDAGDNVGAMRWYGKVLELDPRNEEIAAYITSLAQPGSRHTPRQPERAAPPTIRPEPEPSDSSVRLEDIVSEPDSEQIPIIAPEQIVFSQTQEMLQIQSDEPFEVTDWPNAGASDESTAVDTSPVLEGPWHAQAEASETPSPEHHQAARQHSDTPRLDALMPREEAAYAPTAEELGEEAPAAADAHGSESAPEASVPEQESHVPAEAPAAAAPEPAQAQRDASPFVTETMAELYMRQGLDGEALAIYRELVIRRDDPALHQKIAEIEAKQSVTGKRESVRQFFARIGAVRPHERVEMAAQRQSSLGALLGSANFDASDLSAAQRLSGAFGSPPAGASRS